MARDGNPNISSADDFSLFKNSVLAKYVIRGTDGVEFDDNINAASVAFANESAQTLSLEPLDCDVIDRRYELVRPFIIKVLLYLDMRLDVNELAPLARIIETLALHPELDLNTIISELAELWHTSTNSISKLMRKAFNVYNPSFIDKLSSLTCSQPFTARDVVSDLAVYVRVKYSSGYYARNNG